MSGPAFTDILGEALLRFDEGGDEAVEAFLADHPQHADRLRRRLSDLRGMGMLNDRGEEQSIPASLGEFEVQERLGQGGMGVVYLAHQRSLGREVALKVMRPEHMFFEHAQERFRREVDAVARLEHPGIVRVYSSGEEGSVPFFAMERIHGISLTDLVRDLRDLPPDDVRARDVRACVGSTADGSVHDDRGARWTELCVGWARDLALALDYAHGQGILHRDVKPSNVMLDRSLQVKLLDFGLAAPTGGGSLTRSGSQIGSLPYMAPEQVRGDTDAIDERTDIYGLGVTLYELLTFVSPFYDEGDNAETTYTRVLAAAPPRLRSVRPSVPRDLEIVCLAAMDPDPHRRYAGAADFARDLDNVLARRPIEVQPPSTFRRFRRWTQRHPARATAAALGFLLLGIGPTAFAIRERIVRAEISKARDDAETELATKDEILRFVNDDLLAAVAPDEQGRDVTMRAVLDAASDRIEGRFPERPLVEAELRSTLGFTYRKLSIFDKAVHHLQRSAELWLEHAGQDDRRTLSAQRRLAMTYRSLDRLDDAERLNRKILAVSERALGYDDDDTLATKNNLGYVLFYAGRNSEAEELLRSVYEIRLHKLGEEHEHTRISMKNLGQLYLFWGRIDEAGPLLGRELELARTLLPADHPQLLFSIGNWSRYLSLAGRREESLQYCIELCELSDRVRDENHLETIQCYGDLATAHLACDQNEEGLAALDEAISRATRLPDGHRLVLALRRTRAQALARLNRCEEALQVIDAVLAVIRPRRSFDVRSRCLAEQARGDVLVQMRDWPAALQQYDTALELCEAGNLGGRRVGDVQVNRGGTLRSLGRLAEAERALLAAQEAFAAQGAESRVDRLSAEFIELYEKMDKPAELARWQKVRRELPAGDR